MFRILRIVFLILCSAFLVLPPSVAQKKIVLQAKQYIKSGKDFDKAERLMLELLSDSNSLDNQIKYRLILIDALRAQYEQGNERLYLKQKYDTAALFVTTKKIFDNFNVVDSIAMNLNMKHRYKEKNINFLLKLLPNLYNGGSYYVTKNKFAEAFGFYSQFIDTSEEPLFYNKDNEGKVHRAASMAVYCGYKINDFDKLMEYKSLALKDTSQLAFVYQYMAEGYKQIGDTLNYIDIIKKGFDEFTSFPFFFPRLIEYYNGLERYDESLKYINKALACDSTNVVYRFAKSTVMLNTGRYDECIKLSQDLIAESDTLAEAYYNLGVSYYNQAIELDKVYQRSTKNKKRIRELYEMSRPSIERFRLLAPYQKDKWMPLLYTIYLNLNMGKEFDEINRIR